MLCVYATAFELQTFGLSLKLVVKYPHIVPIPTHNLLFSPHFSNLPTNLQTYRPYKPTDLRSMALQALQTLLNTHSVALFHKPTDKLFYISH